MSKKAFKSQASSSRAAGGAFGGTSDGATFGSGFSSSTFGTVPSSPLSYVYEPPDLSGLSDANVGVAFKNVQKKDGTTKAKALEDLQAYVSSLSPNEGGMEEKMLEAWIKVYPRTSIDTSRRVRQLAHTLQGHIALSCGKRMAKHMPAVSPSWLAGLYDNDKSVSRASNDSFHRVFSSEEKRRNVWRLYQAPILEYSKSVIAKESSTTLSDERTTSPDDASAKYNRVVGAAVIMVTSLLENTPEAEIEKNRGLVAEFLKEGKLWNLTIADDPFARRALYGLLNVSLAKQKSLLDASLVSASMLTAGLHTKQVGSAFDFARTVSILSKELPEVWTLHYAGSGKKSAHNRLIHFLRRGSQGGPPEFWSYVSSLLSSLPSFILINGSEDGPASKADDEAPRHLSLLTALRDGINSKAEARGNHGRAWNTYLDAFELILKALPEPVNRQETSKEALLPILVQYIRPSPELSSWTVSGVQQKSICLRVCNVAIENNPNLFREKLHAISGKIIEDLKTSLPEQSKEYWKSQESIITLANRWYQLQGSLQREKTGNDIRSILDQSVPIEITSALAVIESRNGKPYGAAAAVEKAIYYVPDIVLGNATTRKSLLDFANNVIPGLIMSPSARNLIQILDQLEDKEGVSQAYKKSVQRLTEAPQSEAKSSALQAVISSPRLAQNELLSKVVISSLQCALKNDDDSSWKIVMAAITNPEAPKSLTDDVLIQLFDSLSVEVDRPAGLRGLENAARQREGIVKDFALSAKGSGMLPTVFALSESTDESVARQAKGLSSFLENAIASNGEPGQATKPMLELINKGIGASGPSSLQIDVLVGQAKKLFEQVPPDERPDIAVRLLPRSSQWISAVKPFFTHAPEPSLAITNPLSGALSLVLSTSSNSIDNSIARDENGYSSAFRTMKYTTKLIRSTEAFDHITDDHKAEICTSLAIILQLAGDNLSITGPVPLWDSDDPDLEAEIVDSVAETQSLLASWFAIKTSISKFVLVAQDQLLEDTKGLSAAAYYSARAYIRMASEIAEIHGHKVDNSSNDRLKAMRRSEDVFASAAYLASAPDSKQLRRLCNELIADMTDFDFQGRPEEGLRKMILLTSIFSGADDYVTEIPQQRLVFFVKHAIQQLELLQTNSIISGQITTALIAVLPAINGVYGEFWADILDVVANIGLQASEEKSLFCVHASLRLLSLLRKPHMQEGNDDLLDAWKEKKTATSVTLLEIMVQLADTSDESHQPRRIINELLGRQLTSLSADLDIDEETIYPVLASESAALQQTAYELLHRHVPSVQEQLSVDKALSTDFVAQLPQELLSLILAAPTIEILAESSFERTMPSTLRSYLLSWKITFDHWQNASYKVQADYVTALQEGSYITDLLNLAFDILITARAKPIDASKFDIETYTPGLEESPEKETHWLLIHLYYLSLRHLPSLTKTWWRDTTSRQISLAVATWTEKHISPLIIASELSTITNWAPSQSTADQPMTIKVSPSAREITASIPVDEQTMSISIHLPKSYPLARAEVSSIHRVGVPEKKWNAWLINTQGVINFSSGGAGEGNALIDGLMAWRKNVTAAMKGQSECAICYSVVSGDRQLPSKKCGTCKNMFHSGCLFRWFKSSNSSSCPLCRNAFHYS